MEHCQFTVQQKTLLYFVAGLDGKGPKRLLAAAGEMYPHNNIKGGSPFYSRLRYIFFLALRKIADLLKDEATLAQLPPEDRAFILKIQATFPGKTGDEIFCRIKANAFPGPQKGQKKYLKPVKLALATPVPATPASNSHRPNYIVGKLILKGCPKCGGTVEIQEDQYGPSWSCLVCGWRKDLIEEELRALLQNIVGSR